MALMPSFDMVTTRIIQDCVHIMCARLPLSELKQPPVNGAVAAQARHAGGSRAQAHSRCVGTNHLGVGWSSSGGRQARCETIHDSIVCCAPKQRMWRSPVQGSISRMFQGEKMGSPDAYDCLTSCVFQSHPVLVHYVFLCLIVDALDHLCRNLELGCKSRL